MPFEKDEDVRFAWRKEKWNDGPKNNSRGAASFECVWECSCGMIHVAVGPVDLRFNRGSFLEICEMLREAFGHLKMLSPEAASQTHVDNSDLHSN